MKKISIDDLLVDRWQEAPWANDNFFTMKFAEILAPKARKTYRERLDEQPRNIYGELIPRIVTVRRNLRRLKAGY